MCEDDKMKALRPVTLVGPSIRLEPLSDHHLPGLLSVAADPQVFTWLPVRRPTTPGELRDLIADFFEGQERRQPFAVLMADGQVAGTTSYWDIEPSQDQVEIGATWLRRSSWGTGVNTEAKYLLLCHAFDDLGAAKVVLRTDERNLRSRRAIEKLGARLDREVPRDMRRPDGTWRTSLYYCLERGSWPAAQRALLGRISMRQTHEP